MRQILVWRVARLFWLMTRVWGFWKWRRLFARLCFSERFSSSGSQSSPVRLVVRSSLLEEFVTFGRSQVICVLVFFLLETMDLWAERVASSCDKVRSVGAILVFRQSFIAHWTDRSCRVCVCVCLLTRFFFLFCWGELLVIHVVVIHKCFVTSLTVSFSLLGLKWLKWWRSCLRRWSASIATSSCTRTIRCSRVSMTRPCRWRRPRHAGTLVPGTGLLQLRLKNGFLICTTIPDVLVSRRVHQVSLCLQSSLCHLTKIFFILCRRIEWAFWR